MRKIEERMDRGVEDVDTETGGKEKETWIEFTVTGLIAKKYIYQFFF